MGYTTTSTIDDLIQAVIGEARMWFVDTSLFYRKGGQISDMIQWKDLTNKPGISATFNKYGSVAFGDATEGEDYSATSALTTSGTTVTATEHVLNVPLTDLSKKAAQGGPAQLISDTGRAIGLAAASKFDSDVMALFASLGSTITGGNASGSPLIASEFRQYPRTLRTAKAPEPYVAIFHPWGWDEFLGESSSPLLNAAASADIGTTIWKNLYCGRLLGVECYQHADVPTANAAADFCGAVMSAWAIGCTWAGDLTITPQYDATLRATKMVAVMTYGVGVIDDTMGLQLLMDAD